MTLQRRQRVWTGSQFAVLCACVCAPLAAISGEWSTVPHLNIREEYTDNVTLTGQNTLQDYITSINTGLSVRGNSARLNSNIDYNLQKQIYDSEDNFSGLNHQLQANNALTVIDQWLYFDTNSTISQQTIDNSNTFGRDNRNQAGNRTDVIFYEFKPSVRRRFGSWADFEGSYSKGTTSTSGGNINSRGSGGDEIISLRLSSGRRFSRMPVAVSYNRSEEDFDSGSNNKQERYNAHVSYVLSRKFRFNFEIGSETNSSNFGNNGGGGGLTWSMGATFNPTPRTEMTGNFGERRFGTSKNISIDHRMRRWVFGLKYREDIRTRSQELRDLVLVPIVDEFGNPIFDPTLNPDILNPDDLSSINENSFTSENLSANIAYQGRLSSFTFSYFDSSRTGSGTGMENTNRGVRSSVSRSLSRRLQLAMSLMWRENESDSMLNNKVFLFTPSISYTLGPHTNLSVSYTYRDGGGPGIDDNYIENSLSASVTLHY